MPLSTVSSARTGAASTIADAANHRDYAFDLSGATNPLSPTDSMRSAYQQRVREHIREINRFYGYSGGASGKLPSQSQ